MAAPIAILAVHLMATKRKTLCGLPAKPFPEQQSCPVGMWEAVKPEFRCPICEREYRLECTLESLT